jgi:quercetin dioxygenase-like cupin family protein
VQRADGWIRDERAPEWVTLANGIRIRRMVEGNGCSIILYRLEPGRLFEEHEHPFAEFLVMLAGSGRAIVGDESRTLREGDSVFVPGGTPHGFEVGPRSPVILLNVTVPTISELVEPATAEVVRKALETARVGPRRESRGRGTSG